MRTLTLAFILAMATTGMAGAATQDHDMTSHAAAAQASTRHQGLGVLKEINAKAGKVLIAHEPIPSLQWPAMSMWFELHAVLPNEVRVGSRVQFDLEQIDSRAWVITRIGAQH